MTSNQIIAQLDALIVSQKLVSSRLRVRKSWNSSVMSWMSAGTVLDAIDAVIPASDLRDAYEAMQFTDGIVFG